MSQEKDGPKPVTLSQVIDVPGMYFNGFQIGLSNSDISLLIMCNGTPQANLNMSYTTAKSLKEFLQDTLKHLEAATEHELMTTEYIEVKLREHRKKAN